MFSGVLSELYSFMYTNEKSNKEDAVEANVQIFSGEILVKT